MTEEKIPEILPKRGNKPIEDYMSSVVLTLKKRMDDVSAILSEMTQDSESAEGRKNSEYNEKFNLFLAEMQSLKEYFDYLDADQKLQDFLKENEETMDEEAQEKHMVLAGQVNMAKAWWSRMNKRIIDGHQKIADREARKDTGTFLLAQMSPQQISLAFADAAKMLEEHKDE